MIQKNHLLSLQSETAESAVNSKALSLFESFKGCKTFGLCKVRSFKRWKSSDSKSFPTESKSLTSCVSLFSVIKFSMLKINKQLA